MALCSKNWKIEQETWRMWNEHRSLFNNATNIQKKWPTFIQKFSKDEKLFSYFKNCFFKIALFEEMIPQLTFWVFSNRLFSNKYLKTTYLKQQYEKNLLNREKDAVSKSRTSKHFIKILRRKFWTSPRQKIKPRT
jgi:hypothetical protein